MRAADDALGAAVGIHLGRIPQPVADIQRMFHRRDFLANVSRRQRPSPRFQVQCAPENVWRPRVHS